MARKTSRPTARCPLGVNGGEYPHWSITQICSLAVKLGAEFVELPVRRVIGTGPQAVLKEIRRRGLGIHIGAMVSELADAFVVAHAVGAPLIVAVDDAIERAELSRGQTSRPSGSSSSGSWTSRRIARSASPWRTPSSGSRGCRRTS